MIDKEYTEYNRGFQDGIHAEHTELMKKIKELEKEKFEIKQHSISLNALRRCPECRKVIVIGKMRKVYDK